MSLPKPYYEDGFITIYCGDCKPILEELHNKYALVSDPPYGIDVGWHNVKGAKGVGKGTGKYRCDYKEIQGDKEPFDPSHLLRFQSVLLFGGNHFYNRLPPNGSFHVWWKHDSDVAQADCELCWLKEQKASRVIKHLWNGCMKASEVGIKRVHPSQKPIEVMEWALKKFIPPHLTVIDPYMGSGTTGVACARQMRKFIGIELDDEYCSIAVGRIKQEKEY